MSSQFHFPVTKEETQFLKLLLNQTIYILWQMNLERFIGQADIIVWLNMRACILNCQPIFCVGIVSVCFLCTNEPKSIPEV